MTGRPPRPNIAESTLCPERRTTVSSGASGNWRKQRRRRRGWKPGPGNGNGKQPNGGPVRTTVRPVKILQRARRSHAKGEPMHLRCTEPQPADLLLQTDTVRAVWSGSRRDRETEWPKVSQKRRRPPAVQDRLEPSWPSKSSNLTPSSTRSPTSKWMVPTTPSAGATIVCSIFIASMTASPAPFLTRSP